MDEEIYEENIEEEIHEENMDEEIYEEVYEEIIDDFAYDDWELNPDNDMPVDERIAKIDEARISSQQLLLLEKMGIKEIDLALNIFKEWQEWLIIGKLFSTDVHDHEELWLEWCRACIYLDDLKLKYTPVSPPTKAEVANHYYNIDKSKANFIDKFLYTAAHVLPCTIATDIIITTNRIFMRGDVFYMQVNKKLSVREEMICMYVARSFISKVNGIKTYHGKRGVISFDKMLELAELALS